VFFLSPIVLLNFNRFLHTQAQSRGTKKSEKPRRLRYIKVMIKSISTKLYISKKFFSSKCFKILNKNIRLPLPLADLKEIKRHDKRAFPTDSTQEKENFN
jgi:hypothetical protein